MTPDPSQSWESVARHVADVVLVLRCPWAKNSREALYQLIAEAFRRNEYVMGARPVATLLKEAET